MSAQTGLWAQLMGPTSAASQSAGFEWGARSLTPAPWSSQQRLGTLSPTGDPVSPVLSRWGDRRGAVVSRLGAFSRASGLPRAGLGNGVLGVGADLAWSENSQHPEPWPGSLNKAIGWAGHQKETEPLALSRAMECQPGQTGFLPPPGLGVQERSSLACW